MFTDAIFAELLYVYTPIIHTHKALNVLKRDVKVRYLILLSMNRGKLMLNDILPVLFIGALLYVIMIIVSFFFALIVKDVFEGDKDDNTKK